MSRLFNVDVPEKTIEIKHADWSGNYHSVVGCLGAANEHKSVREEHDYYATSPKAVEFLLSLEDLDENIWEPACGEGHISKVLESAGHTVYSTDLIDRGYGKGNVNFLMCDKKFDGDIVTNPPYKFASEFVWHALELIPEGHKVCMFLKLQFLEGIEHRKCFDAYPPKRLWVTSRRLQCGKNGVFTGGMIAYAWYIWEKGFTGTTELRWFN